MGERSDLIIMERDGDSAGGGYTAWSYVQALEQATLPIYQPSTLLQQDNATSHVSRTAREWFEAHTIPYR